MKRRGACHVETVMKRVVAVALLVLLSFTASLAEAGDLRRGSIIPRVGPIIPHGDNIVPNPPPERFHRRAVRPGFVFVAPPTVVYAPAPACVLPGYWAYQWVPTSYTQSTFVPGGFGPDGTWIEGRYEQRAYASGYYQPYWVPERGC
jgi:hypothetical protein